MWPFSAVRHRTVSFWQQQNGRVITSGTAPQQNWLLVSRYCGVKCKGHDFPFLTKSFAPYEINFRYTTKKMLFLPQIITPFTFLLGTPPERRPDLYPVIDKLPVLSSQRLQRSGSCPDGLQDAPGCVFLGWKPLLRSVHGALPAQATTAATRQRWVST